MSTCKDLNSYAYENSYEQMRDRRRRRFEELDRSGPQSEQGTREAVGFEWMVNDTN